MMSGDAFGGLDSEKGEGLLDLVAFQQWKASRYNSASASIAEQDDREKLYDGLRTEATELYYGLLPVVQSSANRVRLIRYLQGDTLDIIAQSEDVTRQAVHKCLKVTISGLGLGVKKARLVWTWGQTVYSSTSLSP